MTTNIDGFVDKESTVSKKNVRIFSKSRIIKSVINKNVVIGNDSRITESKLENCVEIARRNNIKYSSIGAYSYTGENTVILMSTIGKYCSISWNVTIGGANHNMNHLALSDVGRIFPDEKITNERLKEKELFIGNDVWIAAGVNVLRGVKIGDGAVCGAGAVITKDVPPYAIVVGVPAKIIGYRFSQDIINRLCELKWWDLPYDTLNSCKFCFKDEFTIEKLEYLEREKNKSL